MSENGHSNGAAETVADDTIVLTYNRLTDQLNVGGKYYSHELALSILARASRAIEQKLRIEAAIKAQAELAQLARDQQLAQKLRGGR
jgi:hypothetical protein